MKRSKFESRLQSNKIPAYFEKTTEGFLLKDKNPNKKPISLFNRLIPLFIIIFLFATGWIWIFIFVILPTQLLFNLLFGRDFKTQIIAFILSKSRLFNPEVILSTYPLALGEECELSFRRRFKANLKTKKPKELVFRMACVERVEYTAGKKTIVETHAIWESQPQFHSVPQGADMLSFKTKFTVPNHLSPSFEGTYNQIRWIVLVEQNISRVFKPINYSFVFVVDPVLVK
ncbi:MAG: hypothetical protein AAFX46_17190 [Cyanobacteria bacterium J06636_27]